MPLPDNSKPAGEPDLAPLIDQLNSPDPGVREHAAREIFEVGFSRARRSVGSWFTDHDLTDCFVFDEQGTVPSFPRTTVGIAVESRRFVQIRAANGSPRLADVPPDLDAEEFEIHLGNVRLDILTTLDRDADGAIARFLRKQGEGIQQVELNVSSVDRAAELLRRRFGLTPVYPKSRAGADGTRVNFFLVTLQGNGKLLIELVEENI